MKLRSAEWFQGAKDTSFQHRTAMRALGHVPESFLGKPIIGILNSWNDLNSCNYPHKELVEYVKRGVYMAGGYPVELHTITTPSELMKPSDLPYRNLMAMDVEETIRSLPIDGVVLLCECDKTTPAQLMGAASCNLPTLQLAAGHRSSGSFRGKKVNYGTDLWKYLDDYKAGVLDESQWKELESCMNCSLGGCPVMGTASTMKSMSEMLGMMMPGTSSIPAAHSARKTAAEATGRRIVAMVEEEIMPSKLMTEEAFHNAMKLLAAIGGSTNAVIHLTAIAARLGIFLDLEQFDRCSERIPLLVNLQPSGTGSMDEFYEAGGLSAVIGQLLPVLNGECLGATGESIASIYAAARIDNSAIISSLAEAFKPVSGIAVLKGNIAPAGAILKKSASSDHMHKHRGRAVVFDNYQHMLDNIDREDLEVDESSVLVMKNCGPVGAGMPEWGSIPIPQKMLRQGVRDMVRISDARMSGTSYGTVILHAAPESAVGGPLAVVQNGDWIELDVASGTINILVEDAVITERLQAWVKPDAAHTRGYPRLFANSVLQAPQGCDMDFLRPSCKAEAAFIPPVVGRS
ncbi:dihydroxy-acid dehydratase [Paenibacillus mendelii]|uniref:Dihydroxy-acid dehydratase n=1 Tax=Paenibacillus mendelii TaxID=206163 RepID=A0ABV6JGD8_9BACL|nr:dihydroxy-acid dehydratase [Paenibacillus mendelii]MCQ6557645.1 dihydroxy-acid dehydratase [Paenibacillus mendelii]